MTDLDTAAIRSIHTCDPLDTAAIREGDRTILDLCTALDAARAEFARYETDSCVLELMLFRDLKAQAARAEAAEDLAGHHQELQAEARIAAALNIHVKNSSGYCTACTEEGNEDYFGITWPCPTARALTGGTP